MSSDEKMLGDFSSLDPPYEVTPPLQRVRDEPSSYILNSADFGVPQYRKRLVIIGYRKSLELLDPGITEVFTRLQRWASKRGERGHVTVEDAISDLPPLQPGEGSDRWLDRYPSRKGLTRFQTGIRRGSLGVLNHRAGTHMPSDRDRYRYFIGRHTREGGVTYLWDLARERPDLVPAHKRLDLFEDRFKVQWWGRPSLTITAHISKDGHYFIHPDIDQCRSFTVREAARCQSFPDNFKFE